VQRDRAFRHRRQHSLCQRDGDLIRLAIGDKANIAGARFVAVCDPSGHWK
jgi:hypothetical protein